MTTSLRKVQNSRSTGTLGRRLAVGAGLVAITVVGLGGWSAEVNLASAVIAPGRVVVDGNVKRVQSAHGGPIAETLVREGHRVEADDLLIRLDDTQARGAFNVVSAQLVELEAQRHRLIAERDNAMRIAWPAGFDALHAKSTAHREEEDRLFKLRRDFHEAQKQRLGERIRQSRREIEAISSQKSAKAREIELIRQERGLVRHLEQRRLTTFTRPIAIERDLARFEGDHGALLAQIARIEGQISEIELQIVGLDQNRFSEAQKELRTIVSRIEELTERRVAAAEQLARVEIRAPVSGTVHELAVHGRGAVLRPGETAMVIVPDQSELVAELRIRPQDIDQVAAGQPARLRFTAFNQRTTPELRGRLVRVAPDVMKDKETGQPYYLAAVRVEAGEVARLGELKLVAGMPTEGFVTTGERTFASFLLKPLSDQMQRAFREE